MFGAMDPRTGCLDEGEIRNEAWVKIVGLPLSLWDPIILRRVGEECGGFLANGETGGASMGPDSGEDKRCRFAECVGDWDRGGLLFPCPLVGDQTVPEKGFGGQSRIDWSTKRRGWG